ncbi:MAG: B12-binding domain-containing radical SAM protein [Epsilonproteobacteria bacterium]|nr:B12-binding domain-containing radical SAM protein [Campylobacterota bacterium]
MNTKEIILVGINARYTHTSIGLRYLYANLKNLQSHTKILEFVIGEQSQTLAEKILIYQPKIIGIGVYIWNAMDVYNLIEVIKKVSPQTKIVLGGPEVSHQPFRVNFESADHIIQGEGEISFYRLCQKLLTHQLEPKKIIPAQMPDLKTLHLPYDYYSDHDVQHRYIYVEASRGCPFECEFCLSAIDEKVRHFDMDILVVAFERLWQKGARNFKFIDRTFNLKIKHANQLMDFFLTKDEPYSLHFEVIPDHFPEALKTRILQFPPATLQLEIGIQTLNPQILDNINRNMNLNKVKKNIAFLEHKSKAHLHLDLIVGLPGESLESFAKNLNRLKSMSNSEIQIGILKKLSGTTLHRHDNIYGMVYSDQPPYDILKNDLLDFNTIQKMKRFARFWDLTYNSGNFNKTINYIFEEDVFKGFETFSLWIYEQSESTWQISLNRLSEYIFDFLTTVKGYDHTEIADAILQDIIRVNGRKIPGFLRTHLSHIPDLRKTDLTQHNKRQLLRL